MVAPAELLSQPANRDPNRVGFRRGEAHGTEVEVRREDADDGEADASKLNVAADYLRVRAEAVAPRSV